MSDYAVTILVALYNAGRFIESKITNLCQQTIFDQAQIVLLNCQNLQDEHNKCGDFLQLPNVIEIDYPEYIYLYSTWNDGIKRTTSEFICNSNVDDMWHPTYLERCVEHLRKNPNLACVSTGVLITRTPNQIDHTKWINENGRMPLAIYPKSSAGPCPVWRRSLHDKYGYFDNRVAIIGDALLWEQWLAGGEQFGLIPEYLALYYASSESLERRIDPIADRWARELDLERIGRIVPQPEEEAPKCDDNA